MVEEKQIIKKEIEKTELKKPVEKVEEKPVEKPKENISNNKNEDDGAAKARETPEPASSSKGAQKKEDTEKKGRGGKSSGSEQKEDKKEEKPAEPVVKGKFKEAVVNGKDLRISTKHAVAVCDFIRGKDVDVAIKELEEVENMKRAIPMKGEIPHRKGMMSGRYPVKAVSNFIKLLKSVRANALYHDLELEKLKIYAMANVASRPQKRGGARFKRSHVQIKLVPRAKVKKGKKG